MNAIRLSLIILIAGLGLSYFIKDYCPENCNNKSKTECAKGKTYRIQSTINVAGNTCKVDPTGTSIVENESKAEDAPTQEGTSLTKKWVIFGFLLLVAFLFRYFALSLKNVLRHDSRAKNDAYNFWIQTFILICVGLVIISAILIFALDSKNFLLFGLIGTIMTWIFQDIIKGVVAFYHLYRNDLLHIGDWIQLPNKGIEGKVQDITLTSVTIKNFDETIASIPTATLYAEHMKNLRDLSEGNTHGRRMSMNYPIDTNVVRLLSPEEIKAKRSELEKMGEDVSWMDPYTTPDQTGHQQPVLNVTLLRLHLQRWLLTNEHVSIDPLMIVRLKESSGTGLPLQIMAFLQKRDPKTGEIVSCDFVTFERLQAMVTEHVMEAMEWFGLRMFQNQTSFSMSNATSK